MIAFIWCSGEGKTKEVEDRSVMPGYGEGRGWPGVSEGHKIF